MPGKLAVRFSNSRVPSTHRQHEKISTYGRILQRRPRWQFCGTGLFQSDAWILLLSRAVDLDPHSFFADPDPAVFLNADPDPVPEPALQSLQKITLLSVEKDQKAQR